MNVYLNEEIVVDTESKVVEVLANLPPFCLAQVHKIHLSSSLDDLRYIKYQVCVYCFDPDSFSLD